MRGEDLLELQGDARQQDQRAAFHLKQLAGRGAEGVAQHLGPFEDLGHAEGDRWHRAPATPVASGQLLLQVGPPHEGEPEGAGNRFPGDVVRGGTEAPADHDQLGAGEQLAHRRGDRPDVVLHTPFFDQGEPASRQQAGGQERVGVEPVRAHELRAHGDKGCRLRGRHGGIVAAQGREDGRG